LADAELSLAGSDYPTSATLKVECAELLFRALPWLQQELGMELIIKTGDAPIQLYLQGEAAVGKGAG
jgi:hypothetical protein